MWRMQSGDRVLSAAEWECFREGLGPVRDWAEDELIQESDLFETGVALFDRLSPEQKLALLAQVATALSDPEVPAPRLTAINASAIATVLRAFWDSIRLERDAQQNPSTAESPRCDNRRLLLAVHAEALTPDDLPALIETDEDEWLALFETFEDQILWDRDFHMADDLLDLPPEEMESSLAFLRIDRDYFRSVAHEPNKAELISARQTLARMMGVP